MRSYITTNCTGKNRSEYSFFHGVIDTRKFGKKFNSSVQCLIKSLLFSADDTLHMLPFVPNLRENIPHRFRQHIHQLEKERFVEAQRAAVAHGAAEDAAKYVIAVVVARLDT